MVLLKDLIDDAEAKYGYASPKRPYSGFYWVRKMKSGTKKGYTFQYKIVENGKMTRFTRQNLSELKKEVERRGLPWEVSNLLAAKKLVEDENLNWEDFK